MAQTNNNDTGSLKVGNLLGELAVGDRIQIEGEAKPRTITFLMGKGDKLHVCAKGSGKFPLGLVEISKVS